jgi:hypothetical protein
MTFADQYANHAYADLIREAETQGIEIGASQERERIIKILATMRDTTHEDAWDTLDDAINTINGVSQNTDIEPVSENPDKEN